MFAYFFLIQDFNYFSFSPTSDADINIAIFALKISLWKCEISLTNNVNMSFYSLFSEKSLKWNHNYFILGFRIFFGLNCNVLRQRMLSAYSHLNSRFKYLLLKLINKHCLCSTHTFR